MICLLLMEHVEHVMLWCSFLCLLWRIKDILDEQDNAGCPGLLRLTWICRFLMPETPEVQGATIWRSIWKKIASINIWSFCWIRFALFSKILHNFYNLLFRTLIFTSGLESVDVFFCLYSVIWSLLGQQRDGLEYSLRNIQLWHFMQVSPSPLERYARNISWPCLTSECNYTHKHHTWCVK